MLSSQPDWPGRVLVLGALLAPLVLLVAGLAIHAFRALVLGSAPVDAEVAKRGRSALLGSTIRQGFAWTASPVEEFFVRADASPDALTLAGTVACATGAVVLAAGDLLVGGLMVLGSAGFDFLDGRVARRRAVANPAGEFLDSTLDRWSDAFCFGAAAFLLRDHAASLVACLVAFGATAVVPYARAKAEALGQELRGGLMQRPERLVLFSAAAIFGGAFDPWWPAWAVAPHPTFRAMMAFLAATTAATAFARTRDGFRGIRGRASSRDAGATRGEPGRS